MEEYHVWPTQTASQVVQVAEWLQVEAEIHPVGSKPKTILVCPENVALPFLIPGHRYIFKRAQTWREQQLWSEIIAYELAKLCGIFVPPCFAAFDARTGQSGVLMEFFYGYPDESPSVRLVHGIDLMQRTSATYDPRAGRPHDIPRNIAICRTLGVPMPRRWWAQTLVFDALIGNTDRHSENWGFLRTAADQTDVSFWRMAPPFDHGTSLGYEIREDNLAASLAPAAIARYIERGRHHATWEPTTGRHGDPIFELCRRVCDAHAHVKPGVERVIPTPDAPIDHILSRIVEFDLPVRFTPLRAAFVERLIRARRDALVANLGL